jgi:hypothetical protein
MTIHKIKSGFSPYESYTSPYESYTHREYAFICFIKEAMGRRTYAELKVEYFINMLSSSGDLNCSGPYSARQSVRASLVRLVDRLLARKHMKVERISEQRGPGVSLQYRFELTKKGWSAFPFKLP